MRRAKPKLESELGPPVLAWLEERGWTTYQEVEHRGVADIVATLGSLVCVVELKLQLSWDLLDQGYRWRDRTNATYVAVPETRRIAGPTQDSVSWWRTTNATKARVLDGLGLGLITVGPDERGAMTACLRHEPELRRTRKDSLLKVLRPEHKDAARAGTNAGGRFTPWRASVHRLEQYVRANPGVSLKDAVLACFGPDREEGKRRRIGHWSSGPVARAQIVKQIQNGLIPNLQLERDGKEARLRVRDITAACPDCGAKPPQVCRFNCAAKTWLHSVRP